MSQRIIARMSDGHHMRGALRAQCGSINSAIGGNSASLVPLELHKTLRKGPRDMACYQSSVGLSLVQKICSWPPVITSFAIKLRYLPR